MPNALAQLGAAQRERLAFIEFHLWFLGQVTRRNVVERFEVATAAGTRDLMLYQDLAPENAIYERKAYRYLPTFKPLFAHSANRVLSALTAGFGDGMLGGQGALLSHDVPARLSQPPLERLATVTRAIVGGNPLILKYHSMRRGTEARVIVPHALVDSGLRWHVRAYDRTNEMFRDLVITRMEKVKPLKDGDPGAEVQTSERQGGDEQWQRMVELDLIPHPGHRYPKTIERDLDMTNGKLRVRLRAAVVGYVLRQWQVDCSRDPGCRTSEFRLRLASVENLRFVDNAVLAPGYSP